MEVENNPDASPAETVDAPSPLSSTVSPWLHLASKLLIAVASLEFLFYSLWLLNLLANLAIIHFWYREPITFTNIGGMKPELVMLDFFLAIIFIARAAIIIRAGIGIIHRKDHAWARTAVNCSLLGIFCPFLWVDVPFGCWIAYLLYQDKTKTLFETDTYQPIYSQRRLFTPPDSSDAPPRDA